MVGPQLRKQAVVVMRSEVAVSERRACGLMELYRGTYRYRSRRPEDRRLRTRLRELAEERRRFGYRRLQVLLVREGWQVNHKRVYRLYVEEKLSLRRKRGRKRSGVRQPLPEPVAANQVWSVDFMTDALSSGRRFRTLNIVDDYTRECLAIEVDTSLGGVRVVRVLEELKKQTRAAAADPLRQRAGVLESRCRSVGLRTRSSVAHHPTRTADGERLRREFQRALSR